MHEQYADEWSSHERKTNSTESAYPDENNDAEREWAHINELRRELQVMIETAAPATE